MSAIKAWLMVALFSIGALTMVALLGAASIGSFSRMQHKRWLYDNGLIAQGVVVDGRAGSGIDHTHYCQEVVQFIDGRRQTYRFSAECDGGAPEIGRQMFVRYEAANPSRAVVDDDSGFGDLLLGIFTGFWSIALLGMCGVLLFMGIRMLRQAPVESLSR